MPKVNFEDGIEATRYLFPRLRVDKINCSLWVRAMREYQRLYKENMGVFDKKPLENWAVHIADATRYLGVQYKRLYDVPLPPSTYESAF